MLKVDPRDFLFPYDGPDTDEDRLTFLVIEAYTFKLAEHVLGYTTKELLEGPFAQHSTQMFDTLLAALALIKARILQECTKDPLRRLDYLASANDLERSLVFREGLSEKSYTELEEYLIQELRSQKKC
jgi:hypothetical protein